MYRLTKTSVNMKRIISTLLLLLLSEPLHSGSIVGSRHDLSTSQTPYVCEFCHTPHYASTNIQGLLWNRAETTQTFTLYGSPTMDVAAMQPRGISRLCLSCHDGVNASTMVNGNLVSTKHDLVKPPGGGVPDMTSSPNCERCHVDMYGGRRTLVLGIDLSNDHPVSIPYPTAAQDASFKRPPDANTGWGGLSKNDVKLYAGAVECGSCHNVHNPDYGHFLRKSNSGSALCTTCHIK